MPKIVNPDKPLKPISLRLPVELVERLDQFADKNGFSRTAAITLATNTGMGILEVLLDPRRMLSEPLAAEYIARAIEKTIEEKRNEEKPKQSSKSQA